MIHYSIWYDDKKGCYDIVRWEGSLGSMVQTNIRTIDKAEEALRRWRAREEEKHAQP